MKTYIIQYQENSTYSPIQEEEILANSSADAYSKFMKANDWSVYSAWVDSYITKDGTKHYFNNFSGKAY